MVELLADGDFTGGARQFVETIAFGPGAREKLPQSNARHFRFQRSDVAGRSPTTRMRWRSTSVTWEHSLRPCY